MSGRHGPRPGALLSRARVPGLEMRARRSLHGHLPGYQGRWMPRPRGLQDITPFIKTALMDPWVIGVATGLIAALLFAMVTSGR